MVNYDDITKIIFNISTLYKPVLLSKIQKKMMRCRAHRNNAEPIIINEA